MVQAQITQMTRKILIVNTDGYRWITEQAKHLKEHKNMVCDDCKFTQIDYKVVMVKKGH